MKKFEVGKKYKNCGLSGEPVMVVDNIFTCNYVDKDGDCWSQDAEYLDERTFDGEGWCVATLEELNDGLCVELVEEGAGL